MLRAGYRLGIMVWTTLDRAGNVLCDFVMSHWSRREPLPAGEHWPLLFRGALESFLIPFLFVEWNLEALSFCYKRGFGFGGVRVSDR